MTPTVTIEVFPSVDGSSKGVIGSQLTDAEPGVYELCPVGRSLADDPAAALRGSKAAAEGLVFSERFDDMTGAEMRTFCDRLAERVLRAAETGDDDE